MIVCVCNNVSEREIAREAAGGCASFHQLQDKLKVGTTCGNCLDCAVETFREHARRDAAGARHGVTEVPVTLGSLVTA